MKDKVDIEAVQRSLLEPARSCLAEAELNDLRCLIRITLEFYSYLRSGNPEVRQAAAHLEQRLGSNVPQIPREQLELQFSVESTFSGINSFSNVASAYRVLAGASKSTIDWHTISPSTINERFVLTFHQFVEESNFEKKCRLLLDLFKLQIVFAGLFYE